jgi:hypothetical protein
MNRLLAAIADSENDFPGDDGVAINLSRKDAQDAVKRIAELLAELAEAHTELYDLRHSGKT